MPEAGHALGSSPALPELRPRRLLRQLAGPPRHEHFHHTGHPVVASFEPGERWAWCYVDEMELAVPEEALPYLRS